MPLPIRSVCTVLIAALALTACTYFVSTPLPLADRALALRIGPLNLAAHAHAHAHASDSSHTLTYDTFTVPRDGWITGFLPRMRYADGSEAPTQFLHHIVIAKRDQHRYKLRFLLASGSEATVGQLPAGYGIPVHAGMRFLVSAMFHNPTHEAHRGVYFDGRLPFTPDDGVQRLSPVRSIWLDVNEGEPPNHGYTIGAKQRNVRTRVFRFPFAGRLVYAGGHLHDQADHLRIYRRDTEEVLVDFVPQHAAGKRIRAIAPVTLAPPVQVDTETEYVLEVAYTNTLDREINVMGIALLFIAPAAQTASLN